VSFTENFVSTLGGIAKRDLTPCAFRATSCTTDKFFECFARTGANTPETMSPNSGFP